MVLNVFLIILKSDEFYSCSFAVDLKFFVLISQLHVTNVMFNKAQTF